MALREVSIRLLVALALGAFALLIGHRSHGSVPPEAAESDLTSDELVVLGTLQALERHFDERGPDAVSVAPPGRAGADDRKEF